MAGLWRALDEIAEPARRRVARARARKIRIPDTWPWAQQLPDCLLTALALPPPTHY